MAGNLAGTGEDLDTSLNTIYSEFKLLRDAPGVCRKLATKMSLPAHSGRSKNVLNYDRFTADSLADGADITRAQNLADAVTTYSPSRVGLKVIIPLITLRRVADTALLRKVGTLMQNAYSLKEEQDGTAQFTSYTPIVGSAGTVLGIGHIAAAAARVDIGNNRANPEPFGQDRLVGILHPLQMHHIAMKTVPLTDVPVGTNVYTGLAAGATVGPGRSSLSDEIIRRGPKVLRDVAGVDIYRTPNIAVDSSDDGSGAVFDPESFIYIEEMAADLNQKTPDYSIDSVEIVGQGYYTFGLWRPGAGGCEVLGDCTLPTA